MHDHKGTETHRSSHIQEKNLFCRTYKIFRLHALEMTFLMKKLGRKKADKATESKGGTYEDGKGIDYGNHHYGIFLQWGLCSRAGGD
jgi:hypothetical protein